MSVVSDPEALRQLEEIGRRRFNIPNGRREIGVVDDVGPVGLLIHDPAITYYVALPLRQRGINIYRPSDISVSRPR